MKGLMGFFLSLNVMCNFSFISLVNTISAFSVDFILVLIDCSGRPLPWHLYLPTVHTPISELQSCPSQIYVSEGSWISWSLGCERKERAVMDKCRVWTGRVQGTQDAQERIQLTLLACGAATARGGEPSVSREPQQRLQLLVGCSWDGAGPGLFPGQGSSRAAVLTVGAASGNSGLGDSCWGKFQSRFSVQMLSVWVPPSLLGRRELCVCTPGCLTIVQSWWFHPRSRSFFPR